MTPYLAQGNPVADSSAAELSRQYASEEQTGNHREGESIASRCVPPKAHRRDDVCHPTNAVPIVSVSVTDNKRQPVPLHEPLSHGLCLLQP